MGFSVLDPTGALKTILAAIDAGDITTGVLATARGGTSVDIASAALPLGSGQITFPAVQNASADANTLDDYEEGAYTPTLAINGSTVGITYNANRIGSYTKWGRLIHLDFAFTLTSKGASVGALTMTSLPFSSSGVATGPIDFASGIVGGVTKIPFIAISGATIFYIAYNSIGTRVQMTDTDISNTSTIQGSMIYKI